MVFQYRQRDTSSTNGGLLIYVHEQFKCTNIITDQMSSNWEYLCVEICHLKPHLKKTCDLQCLLETWWQCT